jgi:hypothetical protein
MIGEVPLIPPTHIAEITRAGRSYYRLSRSVAMVQKYVEIDNIS